MKSLLRFCQRLSLALLVISSAAWACKRTAQATEIVFKDAVLKQVASDPRLRRFKIVSVQHKLNIYTVSLKGTFKTETLKFEVVGEPDCKVSVRRL